MSPRWLHWPDVGGWQDVISFPGAVPTTYVVHVNHTGDSSWDGRGLTTSVNIRLVGGVDGLDMYFDSDEERNTAEALFSSYQLVRSDGLTEPITWTQETTRLRYVLTNAWSNSYSYIIQGQ